MNIKQKLSAITSGVAVASKYMYGIAGLSIVVYTLYLAIKNRPRFLAIITVWVIIAGLFFYLQILHCGSIPLDTCRKPLIFM